MARTPTAGTHQALMLPIVDETTAQMVARLRAATGDVAVDALNSAADSDPLTAQNVLVSCHKILGIGCALQLMRL